MALKGTPFSQDNRATGSSLNFTRSPGKIGRGISAREVLRDYSTRKP